MSEPEPEPNTPVVVRTDLRPVGLDALLATLLALAAWVAGLGVVAFAALGWLTFTLVGRARMRSGHSLIGADGLLLEYAGRQRTIPWDASWTFTVRDGLRFRYVTVENATFRPHRVPGLVTSRWQPTPGFPAALDAIDQASRRHPGDLGVVSGRRLPPWLYPGVIAVLLGAAVTLERPWYWFDGSLNNPPPACSVLDPAQARRLDVAPEGQVRPLPPAGGLTAGAQGSSCEWTGDGGTLSVAVARFERSGIRGGAAVADLRFDDNPVPSGLIVRMTHPDVGDESRLASSYTRESSTSDGQPVPGNDAYLLSRRGNVIVYVEWHRSGPSAPAPLPADVVTEVGRAAVAALR